MVSWACVSNAQSLSNKIFGGKNQFETGPTVINFFYNKGFTGLGIDNILSLNRYYGYSRIIKKRHVIRIGYRQFGSDMLPFIVGKVNQHYFRSADLGYGYIFTKCKLQLIGHVGLSYRYDGGESVVFGFRQNTWPEPVFASLVYNSIGGSFDIDANYFFIKNIGVGIKTAYTFYPFEDAKLRGNGIDNPPPILVATYKPINQMLIINGKLMLRF